MKYQEVFYIERDIPEKKNPVFIRQDFLIKAIKSTSQAITLFVTSSPFDQIISAKQNSRKELVAHNGIQYKITKEFVFIKRNGCPVTGG